MRLHPVPQDFRFPRCPVKVLWDRWWSGQPNLKIAPFLKLQEYDLLHSQDSQLLSRARSVMKCIEYNKAWQLHLLLHDQNLASMPFSDSDKVLRMHKLHCVLKCINGFINDAVFDNHRISDLNYDYSVVNKMRRPRKKQRN